MFAQTVTIQNEQGFHVRPAQLSEKQDSLEQRFISRLAKDGPRIAKACWS